MPKTPAVLVILLCLCLSGVGWPHAAAAGASVQDLIAQEKDGSAVGFTGGFGNIIGFRRMSASHHVIFYAADAAGGGDAHALTRIVDGDASWEFTYDEQGQLIAVSDNAGNRLAIAYGGGGSLSYRMSAFDGFASRRTTGSLGVASLTTYRSDARRPNPSAAAAARANPMVEVPLRVRACESWPGRPLAAALTYDFGQGAQTHAVQLARQSGRIFSYNHAVEPQEGLKSDALALALVTNKYPGGVSTCASIARTLKAICTSLPGGPSRLACAASQAAYSANCSFKPRFAKAMGNRNADNIRRNVPDTLNVTGEVFYAGPEGGTVSIAVSKQYQWNQPGQQLLIELPCWNVFQGDFFATSRFVANGGQCKPAIDLGKRASLIVPTEIARGPPIVRFDYFKVLHEKPGCFVGTFVSDYVLWIGGEQIPGNVKASLTQSPPFEEIYAFDLDIDANQASGTFRFQMHHINDHSADITIPVSLNRVIAK